MIAAGRCPIAAFPVARIRLSAYVNGMYTFQSDGLTLRYLDQGAGDPILLIHGFASNLSINWIFPGWVKTLNEAGRRVIAIDNRGHGESDKPLDPDAYKAELMAGDACRLLDHLDLERADVMGYSMGARITALLAMTHGARVRSAVFGGMGMGMIRGTGSPKVIIDALEAPSLDVIDNPRGRAYRQFAETTRSDRRALAACMRARGRRITAEDVAALQMPVLVAVGTRDDVAGSAQDLADLIPDAKVLDIPDRDHMVAVGDKVYKAGVLDFLDARP